MEDNTGSKNVQIFQKHVRVSIPQFKSKRNFAFVTYGNQTVAMMAATMFEERVKSIMTEFESYGRKPTLRQKILTTYGVNSDCFKKSISYQRDELLSRLCGGVCAKLEDDILQSICKVLHDDTLLGKSSVQWTGAGFHAMFQGADQKLEQSFKSIKSASDWLVQMHTADKDNQGFNH